MVRVAGRRMAVLLAVAAAGFIGWMTTAASAQIIGRPPVVGGVAISAEGVISHRADDPSNKLETMRKRLKDSDAAASAKGTRQLKCVSLPKVFAQAKELLAAGKPLPEEIRFLGGLTRIDYVFVYPGEKDLLIAGPAEEWAGGDTLEPTGKITGRPVLQFYDLVTVMRTVGVQRRGHGDFFGCSIDMPEKTREISDEVAKKYGSRPAGEIVEQLKKALGPQKVRVLGTADNTRMALTLVAADYKLKRFSMGLEQTPVQGMGNAVDSSRVAGCLFWFEPSYEALTVGADGNSFAINGPRLVVKAGIQMFDPKGAVTETSRKWTENFNKKLPELVKVEPALADLQNIADLALVATLVRNDGLDRKVEWDATWVLDNAACAVPVVPVPRTAETVASVQGNALACGGVAMSMGGFVGKDARAVAKEGSIPTAVLPAEGKWDSVLKVDAAK